MLKGSVEQLPPLKEVIDAFELRAKKSLGQNFLLDINLTRKIARSAKGLENFTVVEVGPGPGGLTRALFLEGASHVTAIEQDARAIKALQPLVEATGGHLSLVEGDALAFDYSALKGPIKIVANLPYNISTVLLVGWLEQAHLFQSMTLMFQKEVADRLVAEVGSSSYGRLSVMTQWRASAKRCFDLPPEAFTPAPKVTSTVVHIEPYHQESLDVPFKIMETVVKAAFSQRRKMIRSSLKSLWGTETISKIEVAGLNPESRAETLSVEDFVKLSKQAL